MNRIKYVCLSDLHLGEEDSLLTGIGEDGLAAPDETSPVLTALRNCLEELLRDQEEKPVLVLCGDALELALASLDVAGRAFLTFIRKMMPDGGWLFSDIFYLPGNHDHHLWDLARETQYVEHLKRQESVAAIDPAWHTTRLFQGRGDTDDEDVLWSYFLDGLLKVQSRASGFQELSGLRIKIRYPNLAVESRDGKALAVFSHGHYLESLYRGVSKVKTALFPETEEPRDLKRLEGENFAWVDFFSSALSRSGEAGRKSEDVWEGLYSREKLKLLLNNLAQGMDGWLDVPVLGEVAEAVVFRWILNKVLDLVETERDRSRGPLGPDAVQGLGNYLDVLLRDQLSKEYPAGLTKEMTFVFGHTHKPFVHPGRGYRLDLPVRSILNGGGWVLEDPYQDRPNHGAALILLDRELNGAALEMYREQQAEGRFGVKVLEPEPDRTSELGAWLRERLERNPGPWEEFSERVQREIRYRGFFMRKRVEADPSGERPDLS